MNLAALATGDNQINYALAAVTLAVTLPAAGILARAFGSVRQSTLIIPWVWAVGCFALVAATGLYAALVPEGQRPSLFLALQFAAASGSLCPFIALVGAKRPQHSAWSFVVVSLWLVLALPSAEVLLLQPGQALEINSFRGWFLWILIAAEVSAFALTRYGLSVLILAAGQIWWLGRWLPLLPTSIQELSGSEIGGCLLVAIALVSAWLLSRRTAHAVNGFDRVWLDFRDSFGLFWALRLAERVNDAAKQAGWDFDLGWSGFRTKTDFARLENLPPEIAGPLQNNLQGLLRRFVSPEWISERLGQAVDLSAPADADPCRDDPVQQSSSSPAKTSHD